MMCEWYAERANERKKKNKTDRERIMRVCVWLEDKYEFTVGTCMEIKNTGQN